MLKICCMRMTRDWLRFFLQESERDYQDLTNEGRDDAK
jgi:hypothetical protein